MSPVRTLCSSALQLRHICSEQNSSTAERIEFGTSARSCCPAGANS
jgi:hypothetical protein